MNWDDMRIFLALFREGSVSRAGRVLGVMHTTVSRRISALELTLGTKLFDRLPKGYVATQTGESLYDKALAMEAIAMAVDREVAGQDTKLAGSLNITASHDFAIRIILPELKRFTDTHPNINIQLSTTSALMDLAAREADIAVRLTNRPPDYLIGREVMRLQHGIYGTQKTLKALNDTPGVIVFKSDPELPLWVKTHFPKARTVLRVDDVSSMATAVKNHLGIARMPCYMGDTCSELRRLKVALKPSSWGVWVLSHVDLRDTARVRVCREFLLDVINQYGPLIRGEGSRYL